MNTSAPKRIPPGKSRRQLLRPKHGTLAEIARGATVSESLEKQKPHLIGVNELLDAWVTLEEEKSAYGPYLKFLVEQEDVTDILINGADEIWIDGPNGLEQVEFKLGQESEITDLAVRLAAVCGKRLDDALPIVDGVLPDGVRLHAVIPPVAAKNTVISLRCPSKRTLKMKDLLKNGTIHPRLFPTLQAVVNRRQNFLISGATGSGKTTILTALLNSVSARERIVAIEEVAELKPQHPHFISLQERQENVQKSGGISLSELIKAAMRMRPDRIVLGECRGPEVREVLAAMNTGHSGSAGTVHANSISHIPARLISLGTLAQLSVDSITTQIIAGLDCFIHISRSYRSNRRWISGLGIPLLQEGRLQAKPVINISENGKFKVRPEFELLAEKLDLDKPATGSLDYS